MDKSKKHKVPENGQPSAENCECFCGDDLKTLKSEVAKKAAAGSAVPPVEAKESQDYYGQLVQLKADFENYRKRMEKERPSLISWGKAEAIMKFLPLYDLLLAAHQHMGRLQEGSGVKQVDDVVKGLEMIFKEFSKVFEDEGIRPMEPVGKPYDPMATEILGVVDGDDSNDGLVTEELQKGFYYGDKVLRPARVKIAKKKTPPPAEEMEKNEK
jgi:molecular chaperone GrpE